MSALDTQVAGSHYLMPIQPVEFITKNNLTFLEGCVIKRICRHRNKNGKEDLLKAIHEIQLMIEMEYPTTPKYKLGEVVECDPITLQPLP